MINGLKRKLLIKKANPQNDRGRYECKCGVFVTSTEFFVKPAIKFITSLSDIQGLEDSLIDLEVEVTKSDQKCKWIRNGRIINTNEDRWNGRFQITSEGQKHKLSINSLDLKDAGEFIAEFDELISICNLSVIECEKIPRIDATQVPKYIKVKAGKDVCVEVPYDCKNII